MNDWLSEEKINMLKAKIIELKEAGNSITYILACIYDLYQDYIISEDQEEELYYIADPEDKYNDVHDYWYNNDKANVLMDLLK